MNEAEFYTVCEWFEKAIQNALAQGRKESSLLWGDGLFHLKRLYAENQELKKQIKPRVIARKK